MIVMTTLAFGTVHYWALTVFAATAAGLVCLWCLDGLTLRSVQLSRNALQWPLLGMIILGLVQLLPLRAAADNGGLQLSLSRALSLDPNSTRLVLIQLVSLLIYFSATLIFTDSPRRLRALTRTMLVSPADAKHCLWCIHQPASFRRVHGTGDRSAAGPLVLRID